MTVTEDALRARVCGNKPRHLDAGEARREARRVRGKGQNVAHYHCPLCGLWHIGHPPSGETLEALSRLLRGLPLEDPHPHITERTKRRRNRKDRTR